MLARHLSFALLLGCRPRFEQVPSTEPHGVVLLRVAHPSRDLAYTDEVTIDRQPRFTFAKETSVRLAPGAHQLTLASTGRAYAMKTHEAVNSWGQCAGPQCLTYGPTRETRTDLVEVGRWRCSQDLRVDVRAHSEVVALLMAGPGDGCRACELRDRQAWSCP